jgi:hypothetical protein
MGKGCANQEMMDSYRDEQKIKTRGEKKAEA